MTDSCTTCALCTSACYMCNSIYDVSYSQSYSDKEFLEYLAQEVAGTDIML
jgi:heterodisulfide reductase subunit C